MPQNTVLKYFSAKISYLSGDSSKALTKILELIPIDRNFNSLDRQLQIVSLGLLKTIAPEHPVWLRLKDQIAGDVLDAVLEYSLELPDNLVEAAFYKNSLWSRFYSSLPINKQASRGVTGLPKFKNKEE